MIDRKKRGTIRMFLAQKLPCMTQEKESATPPQEAGGEFLSTKELLLEMVKILLLAVVIIIPIRVFFFQPFFVQGASMVPNFEDGQYLVISEFGYKFTDIPFPGKTLQVKPWKNMGRDLSPVAIKDNKVMIKNTLHPEGFVLDEKSYLDASVVTSDMPPLTLTNNQYFVMGDNRPFSYDSRSFGPIEKEAVIGQVLLRAWPLSSVSLF